METNHVGTCVDHTAHLAAEETLEQCPEVNSSIKKCHKFIMTMKDSNLMKEAFYNQMKESGDDHLAIIQGTSNRWYFKLFETEHVYLLKNHEIKNWSALNSS